MRLLHTSDWHVGKTIKGQSRLDEHHKVLAEIVAVADQERPDIVLVAGDLYETAAPAPASQAVVLQAILDLRDTGAAVVVIAGNHDNAASLEAIRPVFAALGVTVIGRPRAPDDGGVLELTTSGGDGVRLAVLPFVSQRGVIRSAQLMAQDGAQNTATYAERVAQILAALTTSFDGAAVNVIVTHAMVEGGVTGGGERSAQTFLDYAVKALAFPASAHYVALGHLHRTQQVAGSAPIWYSGSPLQVDFGEEEHDKHVLVVDATPTTPAQVRQVKIESGRRMRSLRGTLEELREHAGTLGDEFVRVTITEPARAGLAEDVRELLGEGVVDVRLDPSVRANPERARREIDSASPHELFAGYCNSQGVDDPDVRALFAELLDEELQV